MITPDDELLPDDSETEDDEQLSQQDIHSIGLDNDDLISEDTQDESDALARAYDASRSSYELDLGEDDDDLNED